MANMKYFADVNGETVKLENVHHDGHVSITAKHFTGLTPDGQRVTADRVVQFKSNPSLHSCGPRCRNAKGHLCECSCMGKNHGKGYNSPEEKAQEQKNNPRSKTFHQV